MIDSFEWSPKKAETNFKKHSVSFEEAASVFFDPLSLTVPDPRHSDDENRFIITGISDRQRHLVIVHTDRGDKIRIISARLTTPNERRKYEQEIV
ncbi:MAG: BrnT family toxin [Pyrinomonadaceae bacterium]|nr:BrnT family toxin [Pyrinomonadaceae bacterium]